MTMILVNLLFSCGAFASWSPIDDGGSTSEDFEGQVKLIAEDEGEIKVKLSDARGEQEIFRFCNKEESSMNNHPSRQEKIQLVHEAMRTGRSLRVHYPARFENCVEPMGLLSIQ